MRIPFCKLKSVQRQINKDKHSIFLFAKALYEQKKFIDEMFFKATLRKNLERKRTIFPDTYIYIYSK